MKVLVAVVLSLVLISSTTTTIYNANTAAAQQQQQQQPPTPFSAIWTTTKSPSVTMPEEDGQFVQVGWLSDAWDKVLSAGKKYVFKSENNPVQEKVQQAKSITGNAIQETKSLCTTAVTSFSKSLCTTVNKVQGFEQQGQQQLQQLGAVTGQQQLNTNVRDHRQQPGQFQSQQPGQLQDRVETGREPLLTPEAQPPTPQGDVAPPTANQQRLQVSFTSIKINNDHDPQVFGAQNDGEWKIGALVNGQFRDLSPPGSPLGDARGGRTYSLSNIQPVVLNVDKSGGGLVISTIGQELDGCNFNFKIPPAVQAAGNAIGKAIASYYTAGASTKACDAAQGQCEKLHAATWNIQLKVAQGAVNKVCNIFSANDAIGTISDTYGPSTTFGVGSHSTLSTPYSDSGRDFVLTYQIKTVQPGQSQ